MKLNRSYDWYDLDEATRKEAYSKGELVIVEEKNYTWQYLPVLWDNPHINYGESYGLLSFPKIYGGPYDSPKYKGTKWFGVRVFSPDDWDFDLDVELIPNMSNTEADIWYNDLIKITKDYVLTGPVDPHELFNAIKKDFIAKYPNAILQIGY